MGGPFDRAALGPVPAGWQTGPPQFVGVGVPKAGTSWWYSLVTQHPQVAPHRLFDSTRPLQTRELDYFLHFGCRPLTQADVDLYCEAFAAPPGGISGEWSVLYLSHVGCVPNLARAVPTAKLIVMLRNPIDRMASHVNHLVRNRTRALNVAPSSIRLFETFCAYPEATLHSQYGSALKRLLAHFSRKQILVLQYERCKAAPENELARTFRFLGVDECFVPPQCSTPVNQQDYVVERPSEAERRTLADYFRTEVETTVEAFADDVDPALWPDF
jgi:hypothetical protein